MSVKPLFTPHQIVRLQCDRTYLYAEVIQLVESKNICWARPLLLWCCDRIHSEPVASYWLQPNDCSRCQLYDLRQLADLLWPAHLFQPVLDTEAIPLMAHLYHQDHHSIQGTQASGHINSIQIASAKQLRQFVDRVWQSNVEQFPKNVAMPER